MVCLYACKLDTWSAHEFYNPRSISMFERKSMASKASASVVKKILSQTDEYRATCSKINTFTDWVTKSD